MKWWDEVKKEFRIIFGTAKYEDYTWCSFCYKPIRTAATHRASVSSTGQLKWINLHVECTKDYDERLATHMPMENKL
jgi:hypothetical protein